MLAERCWLLGGWVLAPTERRGHGRSEVQVPADRVGASTRPTAWTFEDNAPLAVVTRESIFGNERRHVVHGLFPTPNGVPSQSPRVRPCEENEQGRNPGSAQREDELPRSGYIHVATHAQPRCNSFGVTKPFARVPRVASARRRRRGAQPLGCAS